MVLEIEHDKTSTLSTVADPALAFVAGGDAHVLEHSHPVHQTEVLVDHGDSVLVRRSDGEGDLTAPQFHGGLAVGGMEPVMILTRVDFPDPF
nr:hypothetical protein [Nocardioides agariphilus]